MSADKNWGDLSLKEQNEKIVEVSKLLKAHGLESAKVEAMQQVIYPISEGEIETQDALMIEGSVKQDKADALKEFKKEVYEGALKGINKRTAVVQIECKLGAGDPYKQIEAVVDVHSNDEKTLEHKPGQVLLIDFWATWCPPCQAPMAHNQEMLVHHGDRWGDKVRIVGISIDKSTEVVVNHVKAKGWEKVEHLHRAGSTCSEDYGVNGVPHVVLIDSEGKIAFAGHPAERKLENDIETLIKGEKLSGVSGGDEEGAEESKGEDLDLEKIQEELQRFKETVVSLSKNEALKTAAEEMPRAFIVCLRQTHYNSEKEKFITSYQNINVLVGPQSSIDIVKKEVEAFITDFKGSFKTDYRVRAM